MSMSELQRSLQGSTPKPGGSPIKKSVQGSHAFSAGPPPSALENRNKMADEMRGHWVGPMPVQEFLDDFLPPDKVQGVKAAPQLPNYFNGIKKTKVEREMYGEFIKLVHDGKLNLIPGFKFIDTSNHPDHESRDGKKIKPDPTMYKETVDTSKNVTQFGELELNVEFKTDTSHEPFDDHQGRDGNFESTTKMGKDCRGQLANYATEWCSRQHRLFAFSIFISDPYVRFIRWDRSGAIVSARFDFRTNSQPLIDFLWRFTRLENDTLRGKDETVRPADAEETALAHKHLEEWKSPYERPVIVLQIEDREFIAWGSMSDAESLTGRATRAYPVYEKATELCLFLKDTWRAVTLEKESEILKMLNSKSVRNVPTFVCGDDISHHITLSASYGTEDVPLPTNPSNVATDTNVNDASSKTCISTNNPVTERKPWKIGKNRLVTRVHHRFTEDFIGLPLKKFTSTKELMTAIFDAFIAHYDAYTLCNILHRDISSKNILMRRTGGGGILNDWDLAKKVGDDTPRHHERTGTWQFISTYNLRRHGKPHTVQDDLESFVLVVLYLVLRYTDHNKTEAGNLTTIMTEVFDSYLIWADHTVTGGYAKSAMFRDREFIGWDFEVSGNIPLNSWLDVALTAVKGWHEHLVRLESQAATAAKADPFLLLTKPKSNPVSGDSEELKDHSMLLDFWQRALLHPQWPTGDGPQDHLVDYYKGGHSSRGPNSAGSTGKRAFNDPHEDEDVPKPKKIKSSGNGVFRSKGSQSRLSITTTINDT
ncbi:hypothetical protein Hypma_004781 [Hypsizygus marmoreus]|uniref:Fungal-type protein kinase domain-containing protein n=1 Tax=Hypsizygus marmoreus TaxID=39966 RepID=A0A369J1C2_HYPMA|nr:hypothetical protein Hypma_004781 [Hypsizygus marmoreus]